MQEITTVEQFNEISAGDKKVIIKWFAGWCPDCTRMDMFINPIIEEYNDYTWYSMNRDNFPEQAEKDQVMGIPSLLIYQNSEKLAHLHSANAKSPAQVEAFLDAQK